MSLRPDHLTRLAALNLSGDAMREVLAIVAEASEEDISKVMRAERNRRYYLRRLNKTINTSELDAERGSPSPPMINNSTPPAPSPIQSSLRSDSSSPEDGDLFGEKIKIQKPNAKAEKLRVELQAFGDGWNDLAADLKLPMIDFIDPKSPRERYVIRTIHDLEKKYEISANELFEKIRASPLLRGDVNDFRASFDWICKPTNLQKIVENVYAPSEKKRSNVVAYGRR